MLTPSPGSSFSWWCYQKHLGPRTDILFYWVVGKHSETIEKQKLELRLCARYASLMESLCKIRTWGSYLASYVLRKIWSFFPNNLVNLFQRNLFLTIIKQDISRMLQQASHNLYIMCMGLKNSGQHRRPSKSDIS